MKILLPAAVLMCAGLLSATSADAAVTISINQIGTNVVATASGTFDTTAATSVGNGPSFGNYILPRAGFAAFGTQSGVTGYQMTGPAVLGPGVTRINFTSNSGSAIGVSGGPGNAGVFFVGSGYVSNSQIATTGTIANATLAGIGLTAGVYSYTVGGNMLTVSIGQAAAGVPEPATWAMMLLGFGAMGAALRRRSNATMHVRYA